MTCSGHWTTLRLLLPQRADRPRPIGCLALSARQGYLVAKRVHVARQSGVGRTKADIMPLLASATLVEPCQNRSLRAAAVAASRQRLERQT